MLEKCKFLLKSIEYLGYVISKDGIQSVPTKVEAIVKASTPAVQQLRSFLGLTGKFTNLATLLSRLTIVNREAKKKQAVRECVI